MRNWLRNVYLAVVTVAEALRVSLWNYWLRSYDPKRGTFTERYEYPELPTKVSARFRGFHRYNLTTCIACERCARDCPAGRRKSGRRHPNICRPSAPWHGCNPPEP